MKAGCDKAVIPSFNRDPGVISELSGIAQKAVTEMVPLLNDGSVSASEKLNTALAPFFNLVTVTTKEATPFGEVTFRSRKPFCKGRISLKSSNAFPEYYRTMARSNVCS